MSYKRWQQVILISSLIISHSSIGLQAQNWEEKAQLVGTNVASGDNFGRAVNIDSDLAVVGAFRSDSAAGTDTGAAYIFGKEQTPGHWIEVVELLPSDPTPNALFGVSSSLSGTTAVIGSLRGGQVHVFVQDEGGQDNWGQQGPPLTAGGPADAFGNSVSISGNTLLIGAPFHDAGGTNSGAAYLFERSGGTWSQVRKLVPSDLNANDWFGFEVALSGDTAFVGADPDDVVEPSNSNCDSGSVYVAERNLGGPGNWGFASSKLTPSDAACGDFFGTSIAADGTTAIIGARGKGGGAAYVFSKVGGTWLETAKLTPTGGGRGGFGSFVAIDRNTIIVSDVNAHNFAGAAYVFQKRGSTWTQVVELRPSDSDPVDFFGEGVAIDNQIVMIGATRADTRCSSEVPDCNSGEVRVFVDTGIEPFLRVPIAIEPSIARAEVSSVMDHSDTTLFYQQDGVVLAFNGLEGRVEFGTNSGRPGYRQDCAGSRFVFPGAFDYKGTDGGSRGTCSGFGEDNEPTHYLNYDGHPGTDLKYGLGTEIIAPADGMLEIPGEDQVNGGGDSTPHGHYNTFRIVHANGLETWYLHALEGSECLAFRDRKCVSEDERPAIGAKIQVVAGQVVAHVGATGAGSPHLHFEVRDSATQHVIDPFGCATSVESVDPNGCIGLLWLSSYIVEDGFESGDTSHWILP